MEVLAPLQPGVSSEQTARPEGCYSSLENRILLQASSALPKALSMAPSWASQASSSPCLSLQPSGLSSTKTSSPLLSSSSSLFLSSVSSTHLSSTSSTLVSTENTQLRGDPRLLPLSSSLSSPLSFNPLLNTSLLPPIGHSPPLCSLSTPVGSSGGGGEGRGGADWPPPANLQPCEVAQGQDTRDGPSEEEEEEEMETETEASEMSSVDLELDTIDEEQTVAVQEFCLPEKSKDEKIEILKDQKYRLLNQVCCSLVVKSCAPGEKDWDEENSVWMKIKTLAMDISLSDPQFLLKVAVYTRQELNVRITANFLLALAAHLPGTKSHLRRYFCAAVQLPSDWLEVTRIYSTCFGGCLPHCLKKSLVDKFKQFSEYQLAKYNTRKHRCKHNRHRTKAQEPTPEQLKKWSLLIGADPSTLQKYLQSDKRKVVDKKQSEFSMKKMIKRLHIKEPAEFVMAILGKRYPADARSFSSSGLVGQWHRDRAGQRMKLQQPDTWERKLSQLGNNARAWEQLIDSNSLPFMAMLRNLRNIITQGVSEKHHQKILNRLTSKKAVIQSRQFPFRFLAAYKIMLELGKIAGGGKTPVASSTGLLRDILKKIPKSKRFKRLDWETAGRKRLRVALGVPFVYRIFNMKRKLQRNACKQLYTQKILDRYRQALETAVQISCRYNIPPLPGRTVVILDTSFSHYNAKDCPQDFCLPPDPEGKPEDSSLAVSLQEVALLLSLMIGYSAESCQLMLGTSMNLLEVDLKSDILLDNVRHVMKQVTEHSGRSGPEGVPEINFFTGLNGPANKVNTFVALSQYGSYSLQSNFKRYQTDVNREAVLVNILLDSKYVVPCSESVITEY